MVDDRLLAAFSKMHAEFTPLIPTKTRFGSAKAQEIERDDPPPASYQVGDQIVPDV